MGKGESEKEMSQVKENKAEDFIDTINEARKLHDQKHEIREKEIMMMNYALGLYYEFPSLDQYLEDNKEYFIQWKDWIERRQTQENQLNKVEKYELEELDE